PSRRARPRPRRPGGGRGPACEQLLPALQVPHEPPQPSLPHHRCSHVGVQLLARYGSRKARSVSTRASYPPSVQSELPKEVVPTMVSVPPISMNAGPPESPLQVPRRLVPTPISAVDIDCSLVRTCRLIPSPVWVELSARP